jgi:crossover junction endodeoxyribonuclease RuvC
MTQLDQRIPTQVCRHDSTIGRRCECVARGSGCLQGFGASVSSGLASSLTGVRVVGMDPGLANCGFAALSVSGSRVEALEWGCWHTRPGRPAELRLRELFSKLSALLMKHQPDAVALEDSYVAMDARAALSLGVVRGALIVAVARAGIPVVELPPAVVKRTLCGYGQADKTQMQRMAKALCGLEAVPTPSHAAAAIAVAYCQATAPRQLRLAS